jgi:hypothetical protein
MAGIFCSSYHILDDILCVCLGSSSDGFSWDCFNEQATKDLPNRDGGAWFLGYRGGPFLQNEGREKSNRSEFYLDLNVSGSLCDYAVVFCG